MFTEEICRNCNQPIVWDEWSFVHLNGWADCSLDVLTKKIETVDPSFAEIVIGFKTNSDIKTYASPKTSIEKSHLTDKPC